MRRSWVLFHIYKIVYVFAVVQVARRVAVVGAFLVEWAGFISLK